MDESLIHAFLDDELDPESRRAFEEEARSDADLTREIGELGRLKGLIANAHRPPDPPIDLSGAVVSRIRREEARRRARQPIAASTVLALAALLMITFLWNRSAPPVDDIRVVDLPEGPAIVPGPVGEAAPGGEGLETLVAGGEGSAGRGGAGESGTPSAGPPAWSAIRLEDLDTSAPLPPDRLEAREFLFDLVDRPRSRSIVVEAGPGVPAEVLADDLDELLLDFVREDPRYGRLAGAGSDALFVLLAGDLERDKLRARIAEQLGDRCRIVDPAVADGDPDRGEGEGGGGTSILLAGSGGLVLREAERAAPLGPAPDEHERVIAARQDPHDADSAVTNPGVMPPMLHRRPTSPLIHPLPVPSPPPSGVGPPGVEPASTSDSAGGPAEVLLLRVRSAG